jgi:hypothetical protein
LSWNSNTISDFQQPAEPSSLRWLARRPASATCSTRRDRGLPTRSAGPVRACRPVLAALADADLTRTVTASYQRRFAELKEAINDMIERLSGTLGDRRESRAASSWGEF